MIKQQFGGTWTEEKLECLEKYLIAYRKIFTLNEKAKYFTTYYVDAFAGTGSRSPHSTEKHTQLPSLFEEDELEEINTFFNGSVRIALELPNPFDKYLFIDNNPVYIQSLNELKREFHSLTDRIDIVEAEANSYLLDWCENMDWEKNRAVVFLDPYGMQVEWKLIEALSKTKAIDLWLLFPLGQAVNRCLTTGGYPPQTWSDLLTFTFGTNEWETFYNEEEYDTLFGKEKIVRRMASMGDITSFFVQRLNTIFPGVVQDPLRLLNSKNNPIFILCFASANPRGSRTAVKIARDIIGKMNRSKNG